jgi:uncharacterized protein YxeA
LYNNASGWQSISTNSTCLSTCSINYTTILATNKTYLWNCLAYDNSTQSSWDSSDFRFTISSLPDITIPQIDRTVTTTTSSASMTFVFSEPSNATLEYGKTQALGIQTSSSSFLTQHIFTLNSLDSGTLYYYNITACDSSGNCNETQYTFTTETENNNGGGGGGGGGGSSCTSKEKRCLNNILQVCSGSSWKNNETCVYGCDNINLKCLTQQQVSCVSGSKRCLETLLQECKNNVWQTIEQCTICNQDITKCVLCLEQEKKCSEDDKKLLTCSQGLWLSEDCKKGCDSAGLTCKEKREEKPIASFWPIIIIPSVVIVILAIVFILKFLRKEKYNSYAHYNSNSQQS